jgi:hypothetical protein
MTLSSSHRRPASLAGSWLASLTLAACAPGPTPNDQAGTLGNGSFSYACISNDDPECPDSLDAAATTFPTIALGGTFNITYMSTNSSYPTATVMAVSPEYFVNQGEDFTAILTGTPSFVAETPAGAVLDYTSVTVASINSIVVSDTTSADDSEPYHSYLSTAMGAVDEPLGGRVLYNWSSSDPTVLTLQGGQETPASSVHVVWLKNGTATLTAASGSVSGSLSINVSIEGGVSR